MPRRRTSEGLRTARRPSTNASEADAARRRVDGFLTASISDVQGSIGAIDAKASAALIVHGLLVTGVLTLTVRLGGLYRSASECERLLALVPLALASLAFLGSIFFLLLALLPHRPKQVEKGLREHHRDEYTEAFFPLALLDGDDPFQELLDRVERLGRTGVTAELVAERIKLAEILRDESNQTKWGYRLLMTEVALVALFLGAVAAAAL